MGNKVLAGGKGLVLLKAMATSTSLLNVIRHTQDARKRRAALATLLGYDALGVCGAGMIGATAYGMALVGYAHMVPTLAAVGISVMALIFTLFKSNGYLYAFKDYDLLMAMPFGVRTVVACRFLLMYLRDLPWSVLISLAALVGYALNVQPSAGVYVTWIVLTPVIPLLPTVVASLFGVLIAGIGSRSRHKTLIQIILTFVCVIPMFFVQYIVQYLVRSNQVDSVLAASAQTMSGFSRILPTVGWFERAVNDGDVLSFVLLVVVSLVLYIGLVLLMGRSYRSINSRLMSSAAHRGTRGAAQSYKQRSAVRSIAFKEFKRITGSTICAVNLGLGTVFCLLVSVILPFVDLQTVVTTMAKGHAIDLSPLKLAWPVCVYFFVGMVPSTAPSPSLEGKNYWIIKSLPFDPMAVCRGRMLFNLYMNLVPGLLATAAGLVAMRASVLELGLGLLVISAMCLFSTAYGMRCGLKHLNLEWENEVEVIKRGGAVTFYLLPNLFATMAVASLMFVAGMTGYAVIGAVAVIVVYMVLALLSYRSVHRLA